MTWVRIFEIHTYIPGFKKETADGTKNKYIYAGELYSKHMRLLTCEDLGRYSGLLTIKKKRCLAKRKKKKKMRMLFPRIVN